MECDLIINFGKKYGEDGDLIVNLGKIDSSILELQLPLLGVATYLQDNEELLNKLVDNLTSLFNESIDPINALSNISLRELITNLPIDGGWTPIEDIKDFNYEIVYINKYNPLKTRTIGNKLIVYKNGLYKLNNILKSLACFQKIENGNYKNKDIINKITRKLFNEKNEDGKNKYGLYKRSDVFLKYVTSPEIFPETIEIDNKTYDLSLIFGELLEEISDYKNISYKTDFLNELKYKIINNGNKEFIVGIDQLRKLVLKYDQKADLTTSRSVAAVIRKMLSEDNLFPFRLEKVLVYKDEDESSSITGIQLRNIYPGDIKEITKSEFVSAQKQYALVKQKRGYSIYKSNTRENTYFVLKGILDSKSKIRHKPFVSQEDAEKYIDDAVNYLKLNSALVIDLKESSENLLTVYKNLFRTNIQERQIILILRFDESPGTVNKLGLNFIEEKNYSDFVNLMKSQLDQLTKNGYNTMGLSKDEIIDINEKIDTPHKAKAFIIEYYKKNKTLTNRQIIDKVASLEYEYYYAARTKNSTINLVRINPKETFEETDKEGLLVQIPKQEIIRNLATAIEKQLEGTGFSVKLMTLKEIIEKYGDFRGTAKGFVTGNEIIINTTIADISTPLHEYAHIFLGIIKAQNYDKYIEIITNTLSNYARTTNLNKYLNREYERIKNTYKGLAESDIYEEIFANIFSDYIIGNKYDEFVNPELIQEKLSNIFGLDASSMTFKNIWRYSLSNLNNILPEMRIESVKLLEDILSRFKRNREASNWILKNIANKVIKEDCKL